MRRYFTSLISSVPLPKPRSKVSGASWTNLCLAYAAGFISPDTSYCFAASILDLWVCSFGPKINIFPVNLLNDERRCGHLFEPDDRSSYLDRDFDSLQVLPVDLGQARVGYSNLALNPYIPRQLAD
jgi:hypothetical protein